MRYPDRVTQTARAIKSLCKNFIVLCLAAAFTFSAAGAPSPDQLTRRQQRSRTQRQSRQRVCTSLSLGHAAFHSTFQRNTYPSDAPPALIAAALPPPAFDSTELAIRRAASNRAATQVHPASLPRPPPALA